METERLYYNDCYGASFDARVVKISDDRKRIWLDRTFFYPASGGQPCDFGRLNGLEVVQVRDEDGGVSHLLEQPLPADIETVEGEIDWMRRYDHMQQHTGQHLLSAVFYGVLGYPTLSFNMGVEVSTIELGTPSLSEVDVARVERSANELAWKGVPVSISYEDSAAVTGLRKTSEREGTLRIVEIADVDRSACGGTHVRSTSELGPIQVRGSEKVRGNTRVEFVCGGRALALAKRDYRALADSARDLSCPVAEVPETVVRLRERAVEAEKSVKRLAADIAKWEAETLYRNAAATPGGFRFVSRQRPLIDENARQLAGAFTSMKGAVLALWSKEPYTVLLAASPDSGLHAGNVLKPLLAKYGGKGGGSATLAQGSVPVEKASLVTRELELACECAANNPAGK